MSASPVPHLLWCILVALRTAEQDKPFTSETTRRRFIANWLDVAGKNSEFQGLAAEFTSLRQLLETSDKSVPVDKILNTLLDHAIAAERCDLFRFRSALNTLMQKGWRLAVCRFPESIATTLIQRQRDCCRHALQLTRTENAFRPTGEMVQPVTFHLLVNRTDEAHGEAELIFHTEDFQVVVTDHGLNLNRRRCVRTLYIGTASLPTSEWSPHHEKIWGSGNPPANTANIH